MQAWRPPRCSALRPASRASTAASAASAAALTLRRTTATCAASPSPHWASAISSVRGKEFWCRRGRSPRPTAHTTWAGCGSGGWPWEDPSQDHSPHLAHLPLCQDSGQTVLDKQEALSSVTYTGP